MIEQPYIKKNNMWRALWNPQPTPTFPQTVHRLSHARRSLSTALVENHRNMWKTLWKYEGNIKIF